MPLFFHLTHFRELGQKYKNIFVQFLVQMKTLNFAFEINWPLVVSDPKVKSNEDSNKKRNQKVLKKRKETKKTALHCTALSWVSFWYDYFAAKQILDDRAATIKVGATSLDSRVSRVSAECLKGQIISKANFEVFIWTKSWTKIFFYFCLRSLKWIKSKNEYKLSY